MDIKDDWTPTAANVNALPEPVRRYIHDLETRCDPAGDVAELALARENCRALDIRRDELETEVAAMRSAWASRMIPERGPRQGEW